MLCTVAGHAAAGMSGMLHVGAAGCRHRCFGAPATTMDAEAMDAAMKAVAEQFPAETAGHGGDVARARRCWPTARSSSTSPPRSSTGRSRPASSSRPGPTTAWCRRRPCKVDVGDKVKLVRAERAPESTTVHFHGVRVPNSMDGVDPYTQDPIKPGETFTYEFTAPRARGRHVPLAPQRPGPGAERPVRGLPDRRDAAARTEFASANVGQHRQHGAQRRRHDRAVA